MTIQSLAWALDQPVPGTPKLVLISMGNHADHTTGRVYFDATTIAGEASIQVASLWRYLGALERNGYLSRDDRKTAEGDTRDYWLAFDRDTSAPWSWLAQDGKAEDDEHEVGEATDSDVPPPKASASSSAPSTFRRDRQAKARETLKAAEPLPPPGQVPIIEGSKAFKAWTDHLRARGRIPPFIMSIVADGKPARGFYMPSLFPSRSDNEESQEMSA